MFKKSRRFVRTEFCSFQSVLRINNHNSPNRRNKLLSTQIVGVISLILRRVFGPKRDEVRGEWRKLHNEELSDLYSLPNFVRVVIPRIMRWAGHVARMGEARRVYRVLVGKPEEKRPMGRPRRRWEDNIKMYLQEVGGACGDWMELAQDRDR